MNRQTTMIKRAWNILGCGAGGDRLRAAILLAAFAMSSVLPALADSGSKTGTYSGSITIKDNDASPQNPITIPVSGVPFGGGYSVTKIELKFKSFYHSFPKDVDAVLVAPNGGGAIVVMSDVGGGTPGVPPESPATFIFRDGGGNDLYASRPVEGGVYAPSDFTPGDDIDKFQAVVPPPYKTAFNQFYGTDPNGNWVLHIYDDQPNDLGAVMAGLELIVYYSNEVPQTPTFVAVPNPDGPIDEQNKDNAEPNNKPSENRTKGAKAATITVSDSDSAANQIAVNVVRKDDGATLFSNAWATRRPDTWIWDIYVDVAGDQPATAATKNGQLEITVTDNTGKSSTQTVEAQVRGVNDRPYFQDLVSENLMNSPLPPTLTLTENSNPPLVDLATFRVNDVETARLSLLVLLNSDNKDVIDPANAVITGPDANGVVNVKIKLTPNKYAINPPVRISVTVVDFTPPPQPYPLPMGISRNSDECVVTVFNVNNPPHLTLLDGNVLNINEDSADRPFRVKNEDIDDPPSGLFNYIRYKDGNQPKLFGTQFTDGRGDTQIPGVVIPANNQSERTLLFTPNPNAFGTTILIVGVRDSSSLNPEANGTPTRLFDEKEVTVNVAGTPDMIGLKFDAASVSAAEDSWDADPTKTSSKNFFTITDPDYPNRAVGDKSMYAGTRWSSNNKDVVNDVDQSNFTWTKQVTGKDKDGNDIWRDVLLVKPVPNAVGTATITMEVIDNARGSSFKGMDSFTITFGPVNDAPKLTFGLPTGPVPPGTPPIWGVPNTKQEVTILEGSDILGTTTPNHVAWVAINDPENPSEAKLRFESKNTDIIANDKDHIVIVGSPGVLEVTTTSATWFLVTFKPNNNNVNGKAVIEVSGIDKDGTTINKQNIEITITPQNDKPSIGGVAEVATTDGVAVAKELTVTDASGGSETAPADIAFTATITDAGMAARFGLPVNLPVAVNGGKRIIFFQIQPAVPPVTADELVPVQVVATDTGAPVGTETQTFNLRVKKFNNPPQIEFISGDQTTGEDVPVVVQLRARDIDVPADEIEVGVYAGDKKLIPDGRITTQRISGPDGSGWYYYSAYISPAPELSGTTTIVGVVNDKVNKPITASIGIVINADEEPPIITNKGSMPNKDLAEDTSLEVTAKVFDSEASVKFNGVTYPKDIKVDVTSSEVVRNIEGTDYKYKLSVELISANEVSGVLEYKFKLTPPANFWTGQKAGDVPFVVTVKATDNVPLSDPVLSQHTFSVNVTVVNDPPVIVKDTPFGNALREGSKDTDDDCIKGVITMQEDGAPFEATFNFSDVETAVGRFRNWNNPSGDNDRNYDANQPNFTIISKNETLVPTTKAYVQGSGSQRKLHIEPGPNRSGKTRIGIQLQDGGDLDVAPKGPNWVANTYWLEVVVVGQNDPPTMSPISPVTMNEDGSSTVYFTVDDQETLDYNLLEVAVTSSNTELFQKVIWTFFPNRPNLDNAGTGYIATGGVNNWRSLEFRPKRNMSGTSQITVTLTDADKASFSQTFKVTVNAVNDAPFFSGLPAIDNPITKSEDAANSPPDFIKQTFSVGDVDHPFTDLTVTGVSLNPTVVPSANILLTLADDPNESGFNRANLFVTIIPNQNFGGNVWGEAEIELTVTDAAGAFSKGNFKVKILPDNDAPSIAGLPGTLNIPQNQSRIAQFQVWDEFGETAPADLTIVATSDKPALIPNGNIVIGRTTVGQKDNGTFTITPVQGQTGTAVITVMVTDDGKPMGNNFGANAAQRKSTTVNMTVIVGDVPNTPPWISPIPNQQTLVGQFVQVPFTVNDAETPVNDLTVFGQSSNPELIPNAAIFLSGVGANRSAFIVPAANKTGSSTITITVADGGGLTSQTTFVINVSDAAVQNMADFNGDGKPDLLLQRNDGTIAIWYLNGAQVTGGSLFTPGNVGLDWLLVSAGDFNADGSPDLLFQNKVDGSLAVWLMNGTTLIAAQFLTPNNPGLDWKAVGVADVNEDGKPDVVFQHADGSVAVWYMNGLNAVAYNFFNPVGPSDPNYKVVGLGDLNGDKKMDIVYQHQVSKQMAVWFMNGLNMVAGAMFNPSSASDPTFVAGAVADYDGDGKADVVFYNQSVFAIWFMNDANLKQGAFLTTAPGETGWTVAGP